MEQERNRLQITYETVIRLSMDGFWTVDLQGKILEVNSAYCKMSGFSREELLKMHLKDLEANEDPETIARHIQQVIANGYERFETRHRCKDGTFIDLEITTTYLKETGNRIFSFLRDITEKKKNDAESCRFRRSTVWQG
jgi:PAS domain S-box-containing protein